MCVFVWSCCEDEFTGLTFCLTFSWFHIICLQCLLPMPSAVLIQSQSNVILATSTVKVEKPPPRRHFVGRLNRKDKTKEQTAVGQSAGQYLFADTVQDFRHCFRLMSSNHLSYLLSFLSFHCTLSCWCIIWTSDSVTLSFNPKWHLIEE